MAKRSSKKKEHDFSIIAHRVVQEATGEAEPFGHRSLTSFTILSISDWGMMERARSMAERRTINYNGGQNDAPQIRSATEKIKPHAKPSNRRHNRQRTIKNQIRKIV